MLRASIGSSAVLAVVLAWLDVRPAVGDAADEAPPAQAFATFKSDRGFSISYPADWTVASDQQRGQVAQEAQRHVKQGVQGFAFMAANLDGGIFKENINVVVTKGGPSVDEKGARDYVDQVTKQMRDIGWNPTDVVSECATFNGRKGISLKWKVHMPGTPFPIRQWQVVLPAGAQSYCITCSAQDSAFERCKPIFATVFNSVEIHGGTGWDGLPPVLRYAILGAIIGGVGGGCVALIKKLSRRDAPKADAPAAPDSSTPL